MIKKNSFSHLQIKHLFYLAFLLFAFILRFYAASHLAITQPEANILLSITDHGNSASGYGSIFYELLTKPLFLIFGTSNFAIRFWTVIAGVLIVLLPLLFEDFLGVRTSLILSFLLTIDPFQIANSVQINGNTLTILLIISTIGFITKKKYPAAFTAFTGFICSGFGFIYGIIFAIFFAGILFLTRCQNSIVDFIKDIVKPEKIKGQAFTIVVIFAGIVFILFNIEISTMAENLISFFKGWSQPYQMGSFPQLFPILLLVYFPLGFYGLCLFPMVKAAKQISIYPFAWIIFTLLFIALYPAHKALDLVWVSLVICLVCAFSLDSMVVEYVNYPLKNWIYILVLTCVLISLSITSVILIYQFNYGLNPVDIILAIISLLFLAILSVIFMAYNETIRFAAAAVKISLLLILLVVQLSSSFRSAGTNGHLQSEVLWSGYFQDADLVNQIIANADLRTIDLDINNKITFLDYENPVVKWNVVQNYPQTEIEFEKTGQTSAVIFTPENELSVISKGGYYGLQFVANSYPMWIWQPVKNILDSDFWFWLVFRQSQMYYEYDYIWVNKTIF